MERYEKAKIFTIRTPHNDKYYIGSTCLDLPRCFRQIRKSFSKYEKGNRHYESVFELLKLGDTYIELLEDFPCQSKNQLVKRRGELQRENKDFIVNVNLGYTKNEHAKTYREKHKERLKETEKERARKYREEKLKEKTICECGGRYTYQNKSSHMKTTKHLNWENKNTKPTFD